MLILSLPGLLQNQSLETIQVCIVVLCFPRNNIAGLHLCDECTKSNAPNVCHKISSTLWPHEQVFFHRPQDIRSSNTTQIQTFGNNLWTNLWHFSDRSHFLLPWIDGHPCMELQLWIIVESSYLQIRKIYPHISLRDLPSHGTKKRYTDFPSRVTFPLLLRNFWIQTWFCTCPKSLCLFHIVLEITRSFPDRGKVLVLPNQRLSWVFSTLGLCSVSFQLISSTYTDKNRPSSRLTNKHSQFGTFSQPCSNRTFTNCLSHNSPAKGWPYRFLSRGTTGSSILDNDLGHLCRGRRIQMSGHSDFGIFNNLWASSIFTWVYADTASAACPEHPGSLEKCPWLLRLSFEVLMILAQWTLHTNQNHLSQCHFGVRPCLCTFDIEAPAPNSQDDRDPLMTQSELCCP